MKTIDVKNIKPAKKYSKAILQSAIENNNLDKVYNDLIFITETLNTNKELYDFLNTPLVKIDDKKDVIQKLFSTHIEKITLDFLYVLADNNRLNAINEILNRFSDGYNKVNNIVKPTIISAVELDEIQKNRLTEKLEQKLSKKVIPEYITDESVIGGFVIEMEDKTIDCSLKAKFENMKKQLIKGNRYGSD